MYEAEVFNCWWLIPLVLIGLCFIGFRGCCAGRSRYLPGPEDHKSDADAGSALEILGRRYVRGEIDEKEYRRKHEIITRTDEGETA